MDGVLVTKPSMQVSEDAKIEAKPFEFVSRGGFKLQKALEEFHINLQGRVVLDVGASTGGTDIPPLIFQKYFNTPVSVSLWLIDGFIILLQFVACATIPIGTLLPNIFYGILITLLTSVSIDKVSPIGMRRTQVKIISNHYLEIRDMILTKIDRGVTVLYGQTGYLKEDCHMLLTVISHRQLVRLKAEVEKIDPEAFMTVSVVSEVRGRGFHSDGVDFLIPEEEGKKTVQKEGEGHEND